MVSRNYTVQSEKKAGELYAKSPNNSYGNPPSKSSASNAPKSKQNIYQKQASVGTQFTSPQAPAVRESNSPNSNRYTYSTPTKPKSDKSSVIPTYTSIVNHDLSPQVDLKCLTPLSGGSASYSYASPNNDPNYNDSGAHKQRSNSVDTLYSTSNGSFDNSNTENFSVQGYKIRIPLSNVSPNNNTNNNLPTIAESVVDDTEYPVDVQPYGYTPKDAKCSRNATVKCRDAGEVGSLCFCKDHAPYGCHRNGRFQYISDRPRDSIDSPKGNNNYKYQGTHPDSLYRVAQLTGPERGGEGGHGGRWTSGSSRMRGPLRLLRWPLALAAVCIALALLVYFLMPDTSSLPVDNTNSTEWLQSAGQSQKEYFRPGDPKQNDSDKEANNSERTHSKILLDTLAAKRPETKPEKEKDELIFGYSDDDKADDEGFQSFVELIPTAGLDSKTVNKPSSTTPSAPVFPTNLSPSVQYGNEHEDAESNEKRNPKKVVGVHPVTDIYDDKFLTNTFAIFYNKDGLESTPSGSEESVEKDDDKFNGERPDISGPNIDKGAQAMQSIPRFTSGHQNSFGIPIEEAANLRSTTQSSVYNTRVSPTLPSMVGRNKVRSTTVRSRWNSTEDGICFSTRLSMCRGVLPYDLTTLPLGGGGRLLEAAPLLQVLLRSGCSPRARQFLCSLLEPECRPQGMKVLPPCRPACDEIAGSCHDVISAAPAELAAVFDCAQYPAMGSGEECAPGRGAAGPSGRGACPPGETRCTLDGSCVPEHWRCDTISDCPGGTDEQGCDERCGPNEFRCSNKGCIPEEWVCDGHQDCVGGGEDELECGQGGGAAEQEDVLGAASQHPRPARLPRPPRLQTTTAKTTIAADTVTAKTTMEYENSKEILMMSDSVLPKFKPFSALNRKKAALTSTTAPQIIQVTTAPQVIQVTSASSSVSVRRASPCPIGDPNCKKRLTNRVPPCIKGTCMEAKEKLVTMPTEGYNITRKIEEMESVSSLTSHSSPCPQGELRCVDGRCITLEQLCDHKKDCTDGADETKCFP